MNAVHFLNPLHQLSRICYEVKSKATDTVLDCFRTLFQNTASKIEPRRIIPLTFSKVALFALAILAAQARAQNSAFLKNFGSSTVFDEAKALVIDANGNIFIAGDTGLYNLMLAKFSPNGEITWSKTLGGVNNEYGYALATDTNDNIIVAGSTASFGAGSYDVLLAKYDPSGSLSWAKTLGGTIDDYAYAMDIDGSGNIVIAGRTYSFGAGNYDLLVAKFDPNGAPIWVKTLGGAGLDSAFALKIDANENIIVAGYTFSFGAGNSDVIVAKFDSNGTLSWSKALGGAGADVANAVRTDIINNIVIAGATPSFGAGNFDFLVAKFDPNGVLVWAKTLGDVGDEKANTLGFDDQGNIVTSGYTTSFGGGSEILVAKFDPNGVLVWAKTLGSSANDYAFAQGIDTNNNIVITGYTYSFGANSGDVILSRIASDGIMNNCSYLRAVNPVEMNQTLAISLATPNPTINTWISATALSWTNGTVSTINTPTDLYRCVPLTTTGVATTGVQTTGIATTGIATTGALTTGVATTGVQTTGIATTGVATTGALTTGVATTGIFTTGKVTTGVYTTGTKPPGATTGPATTGPKPPGMTTTTTSGGGVPPPGRQTADLGLILGLTFGLGSLSAAVGAIAGFFLWRYRKQASQESNLEPQPNSLSASQFSSPVNEDHLYQNAEQHELTHSYENVPKNPQKYSQIDSVIAHKTEYVTFLQDSTRLKSVDKDPYGVIISPNMDGPHNYENISR